MTELFVPAARSNAPISNVAAAIPSMLMSGEQALVALRTDFFNGGIRIAMVHVLVTDRAVSLVEKKVFGGLKRSLDIPIRQLGEIACGPLMGVGPTWVVSFSADHRAYSFYADDPDDAQRIAQILIDAAH